MSKSNKFMALEKKDTRLNIRISEEELEQMKELASKAKMTLADWVRQQLLGRKNEVHDLKMQIEQFKTTTCSARS